MEWLWTVFLAAALQGGAAAEPGRQLDRGGQTFVDDRRQVVARTQEEWSALWKQHAPDRPMPRVDFAKEMVIGVFMGSRPTAGFSVRIVSAAEDRGEFVVRYLEQRPAADRMTAQVITSPYHIIAVPRSAAPAKFVSVPPAIQ